MSAEIVPAPSGEVQPVPLSDSGAVLAVIAAAARDPQVDVSKMRELLDMQERVLARVAESAFNVAMRAAQAEIMPVVRDAQNSHTHSRYARLETIDARIRPIYTRHGFSLSFNTAEPRAAGAVRIVCDVRHIDGHKMRYELEGELDVSGAKGTSNKTSIQGLGSSTSYLRRYLTAMIFNVVLTNEDNDGAPTANLITEEQVIEIAALLDQLRIRESDPKFLAFAGADKLEHIPASSYQRVVATLRERLKGAK